MTYAPIVIFCYNRPSHLSKLLQSLKTCPELLESKVYFFRDGPRSNTLVEGNKIAEVDKVIDSFNQSCEVTVKRSDSNKGLANSIKNGVSAVLDYHKEVIVLEDDLIVSSGFLAFMNEALKLYENSDEVMHISGYMFPIQLNEETLFYNYTSCWGWATWKSAWQKLEWDCLLLKRKLIQTGKWDHFTLFGFNSNEAQLNLNILGQRKTWAVRWNASVAINGGYCLHPGRSLVNNNGFDGSGENCADSDEIYFHLELPSKVSVLPIEMKESSDALIKMQSFYQSQKKQLTLLDSVKQNRAVNRILDISPRKLIARAKRGKNEVLNDLRSIPRYKEFQVDIGGLSLKGVDSASFLSMWSDIFEKEIYLFEPKHDRPIIFDAGANIGLSSVYWSKKFPSARIYAYEADPYVYSVLSKNLEENDCSNVVAKNKALWFEESQLQFNSEGADAGRIQKGVNDFVNIQSVSILKEIEDLGESVDLVKMDIEGAEVAIFENNAEFVEKTEYLFVEYHSFEGEEQKLGLILETLRSKNMRYSVFNEYDVIPKSPFINRRTYGIMDLQVNIFAEKTR